MKLMQGRFLFESYQYFLFLSHVELLGFCRNPMKITQFKQQL